MSWEDRDVFGAVSVITKALDPLRPEQRTRVLEWAIDTYGGSADLQKVQSRAEGHGKRGPENRSFEVQQPESEAKYAILSDFLAATQPKTDWQKALVAIYWRQVCLGETSSEAQTLNMELKLSQNGIRNVSRAMDQLRVMVPALVSEVNRLRDTGQARKAFQITTAGKRIVEDMVLLKARGS